VAIWQHNKSEFWDYFHCACAKTAIRELPVKNLTLPFAPATSISYKIVVIPLPSDVYGIYSMPFATTSHDLVTLTFDLLTLRASRVQCLSCPTHMSYDYRLLSYVYWIFDHISVMWTVTAHAPCHVTSNRGQKLSTFLKSLTPIYLFTLSLSGRYDKD